MFGSRAAWHNQYRSERRCKDAIGTCEEIFQRSARKNFRSPCIPRRERRYSAITQADDRTSQRTRKVRTTLRWHLFTYLAANGNYCIDLRVLTGILSFRCRGSIASIRQRTLCLPLQAERRRETVFLKRCSSTEKSHQRKQAKARVNPVSVILQSELPQGFLLSLGGEAGRRGLTSYIVRSVFKPGSAPGCDDWSGSSGRPTKLLGMVQKTSS